MQIQELPYTEDPLSLYADQITQPYGFVLTGGRYTILGWDPVELVTEGEDPFQTIQDLTPDFKSDISPCGGWYGYLGYELAERLHAHLPPRERDLDIPDLCMGLYERVVVFDCVEKRGYCVSHGLKEEQHLGAASPDEYSGGTPTPTPRNDGNLLFESNLPYDQYNAAFSKIQSALKQGDCYQVNLAQRFTAKFEGSAWTYFLELMKKNPAPFAAYYQLPEAAIISCSPERFIRIDQDQIYTQPIKGTIASHQDPELLQHSEKNRAENLMIVDLMRNDLGKICISGSIKVPELFKIESYPSVHHLVSTITGILKPEMTPINALKACFPGGSITGAPKLAAMQQIRQLEPHARHVYCGCIGYSDFSGVLDMNIAIRTAVMTQGACHLWAGGGIVLDSACEAEYQECLDKVEPFFKFVI